MDSALNRSGVLVHAARAKFGGAFRCPICRIPVIYASGRKQSPHFRHSPRTQIEEQRIHDCPNYVADQGGNPIGSYRGRIAAPPAPPRPHLAVAWVRSGEVDQCWALMTTIPVPPDAVSWICIDDSINGSAPIVRDLIVKKRQFFVRANSREYRVIGYNQQRQVVWQPSSTDPLIISGLNFFRAGANGGILLEPEESLLKGRTYFVLCAPRAWFSPPVGLFREVPRAIFCDPKREWIGFLVYLPRGKRLDIDSWCSSAGRDLIDPQSELDLVLPPARAIQPDGSFRIAAGQEVVLSLRGGDWIEPTVEVLAEETGESQEWELGIEADDYLRLGKFEPGTYAIHVRDWQMVSLRLTVVEATNSVIGGVVLRTASLDSKKELRATLPAHDASERWDAIMSGRELWRGIDLPDHWPVSLRWSTEKHAEESRSELATPEAVAGSLSDCLAVDPSYATLDAGVFGTICYEKPAHRTKTPLIEGLPANLCSRLQWLALARMASSQGAFAPLALSFSKWTTNWLRESDRQLVTGFLEVARWPVALLPQARSVGQELARRLVREPKNAPTRRPQPLP